MGESFMFSAVLTKTAKAYPQIPNTYKFLGDVIFGVFAGNLSSMKIKSSKFIAMHMELKG